MLSAPSDPLLPLLERIAEALERMAPKPPPPPEPSALGPAYVFHAPDRRLKPVPRVARLPMAALKGVERQKTVLQENTRRFADGLPANNALLWGARGMGKSSLVKAVHGALADRLTLVEIARDDLALLPELLDQLWLWAPRRILLFCDDLSFDEHDSSYKALKAVLDGGVQGRPPHVLFYATSNRRHLMPRRSIEQEEQEAIHRHEAVDEKVSLSDRFGLWLGFHPCTQDEYLDMVLGYAGLLGLTTPAEEIRRLALSWSVTRGARSGRVAWQFALDLAGAEGRPLPADLGG